MTAAAACLAITALASGLGPRSGASAAVDAMAMDSGSAAVPVGTDALERSKLEKAFAAAFGVPDQVARRVGPERELTRFTPSALIDAPFGRVLVSEGVVLEPRADSMGKLAIVYFEARAGLRPRARFVPAVESGSIGRLDEWRVRTPRGAYPLIEIDPGERCVPPMRIELRPAGPRLLPASAAPGKC